jgi:2'-hydroxyisoflavone reductase
VLGDRSASGLDLLRRRSWDVVLDTSGYEVGPVRASARLARDAGARYVFVSTMSVYAALDRRTEGDAVQVQEGIEEAELSLERYGALKAACERALEEELPGRVLHVRAGLILGPHDYDLRFPWWLRRVARGGDVLAPGDPEATVQAIDARDLASWMVAAAERHLAGAFNAVGPDEPLSMGTLLETLRDVTGSDARFVWAPDEVLREHEVKPYSQMPFWLPRSLGAVPVATDRARAAGLRCRPFVDTARDTWAWLSTGWDDEAAVRENRRMRVPAGISDERERKILVACSPRSTA